MGTAASNSNNHHVQQTPTSVIRKDTNNSVLDKRDYEADTFSKRDSETIVQSLSNTHLSLDTEQEAEAFLYNGKHSQLSKSMPFPPISAKGKPLTARSGVHSIHDDADNDSDETDESSFETGDDYENLLSPSKTCTSERRNGKINLERSFKQKMHALKSQNTSLIKQVEDLEGENDELRTRLSRVQGDLLSDNNPHVSDLTDKNRPTKIAERFSELYNNEWTNAYEKLVDTGHMKPLETVNILLQILQGVYSVCYEKSKLDLDVVTTSIAKFTGCVNYENLPRTLRSSLQEYTAFRKRNHQAFLPELQKVAESVVEMWISYPSQRSQELLRVLPRCYRAVLAYVHPTPTSCHGNRMQRWRPFRQKHVYRIYGRGDIV
ncbi:hypothetical protein DPMN_114517 [Dreissena polymorpha]|uniref:Uncharacterized protein n=2 Tax=Dreissena polymorpha TaxID=45954 RepID=A0A9D4KJM1_DREPO|nr:hypothetical protein DPMN_114517 [Dreissena polymorpha]